MKIGVSSYSFSQYISDGRLTTRQAVAKAAQMGFAAIEFTQLEPEEGMSREEYARLLASEAEKHKIEISAYVCGGDLLQHCGRERQAQAEAALTDSALDILARSRRRQAEVERLKGEIDLASILGVKLFRYDVLYRLPAGVCFAQALKEVSPAMRELAEYASQYGIRTMIENHGQAFQDSDRLEQVYDAVNHENFGLLVDIGNFMCADEEPALAVSRVANLAAHVHAKDFVKLDFYSEESKEHCFTTRGCNYLKGTAVGSGEAKAAQCLEILKQAGYDGYVDIEFEGPEDCLEELKKGLEFLKGRA